MLRAHGTTRDHLDAMVDFEEFNALIDLDAHYALERRALNRRDEG